MSSALTRQLERERMRIREAWRSGFMVGALAGFLTLAPIVIFVLMLAARAPK